MKNQAVPLAIFLLLFGKYALAHHLFCLSGNPNEVGGFKSLIFFCSGASTLLIIELVIYSTYAVYHHRSYIHVILSESGEWRKLFSYFLQNEIRSTVMQKTELSFQTAHLQVLMSNECPGACYVRESVALFSLQKAGRKAFGGNAPTQIQTAGVVFLQLWLHLMPACWCHTAVLMGQKKTNGWQNTCTVPGLCRRVCVANKAKRIQLEARASFLCFSQK